MSEHNKEAIALFSGGLDSILAARLIMEQGINVHCIHFTSPFFGSPSMVGRWKKWYGLDVHCVDIGAEFAAMLVNKPEHGFGKILNPCVDCKILMMRKAKEIMEARGASFLISGEVLGQRPMSQRRDTLNIIHNSAGVKGLLLRPLCAQCLEPTQPELSGIVDRSRLLKMQGRGRKAQLDLAKAYGFQKIPTPAGGCRLAEKENALRYWAVLNKWAPPSAEAFELANTGRQFWAQNDTGVFWLAIGRHEADNEVLGKLAPPLDGLTLKTVDFPGPMALAPQGSRWTPELVSEAAALVASFSPKAVATQQMVTVRASYKGQHSLVSVLPSKSLVFRQNEENWPEVRELLRGKTVE